MSHWYEVFDNEEVQWQARQQATYLTAAVGVTVGLTLALAGLGLGGVLPLPLVGGALVVMWFGMVRWTSARLRKLRRIVWCIKLSEDRVVGYDYTRRKHVIDWSQIHRVELVRKGMLLVGEEGGLFNVPHLFPNFHTLSHRVVHYAEMNGVPVFIDGQPWQALDVYALFPFLADDAPEAEA